MILFRNVPVSKSVLLLSRENKRSVINTVNILKTKQKRIYLLHDMRIVSAD